MLLNCGISLNIQTHSLDQIKAEYQSNQMVQIMGIML